MFPFPVESPIEQTSLIVPSTGRQYRFLCFMVLEVVMRCLGIRLFALCVLTVTCACTGFAADEPSTLASDIALFREGQEVPPYRLLGVVYEHRWSRPGSPAPEWQVLYDTIASKARRLGADMVVGAMTGEEDPVVQEGEVKWFLGLAAISTTAVGDSLKECDNCVAGWSTSYVSSAGSSDPELLSLVERKAFAISRLRLAEAGYYLRDRTVADQTQPDTTGASNLRLEVLVNRGPTEHLATPENMSFAAHLIWNASNTDAWKRTLMVTAPSSRLEESDQTTRNALIDLYSNLPGRGHTPDSDGDGVPDSRDQEPRTLEGAEVDFLGKSRDDDGDGVPNGIDRDPYTMRGVPVDQWGRPVDADADGVADYIDECPDTPADYEVDQRGCPIERWIAVIEDALVDQGVLRETLPFDLGSADLRPESEARLDTIGVALSGLKELHFRVEGHCDDQGNDALNDALSEMRAAAVIDYLVKNFSDLTRGQFTAKGWGKRRPIAAATDELSRAMNRRVEFLVENPEEAKRVVMKKRTVRRGESLDGSPADDPGQ